MRLSMKRLSLPIRLFCLAATLAALAGIAGAASLPQAKSGHVVARTKRTVGKKSETVTADLWFTSTRSRIAIRREAAAPVIEMYDGRAMYRWVEGARTGRIWHPTGMRVLSDVVAPLLDSARSSKRKRVGTAKVAGIPCTIYQDAVPAPKDGSAWWTGTLQVRTWESQDRRFPYVLRSSGKDSAGNTLESEVTSLSLNPRVSEKLFVRPANIVFYKPILARRGDQVAGASKPLKAKVAFHLGDALAKGKAAPGKRIVTVAGTRIALDKTPLASERDVEEVRLEPEGPGLLPTGEALAFYLKPEPAVRVARATAKARGRHFAILIGSEAVAASRIYTPWAEENVRVPILDQSQRLRDLAKRLNNPNAKTGR